MIKLADWSMRGELQTLWQTAFEEGPRPAKLFFQNFFRPENCVVAVEGGTLASMLHLLPARLSMPGGSVRIHYVFACATFPEFRGKGHMGKLLEFAAEYGAKRGDRFSAILPADEGLYRFYERFGYESYFQMDELAFTREALLKAAGGQTGDARLPDIPALCRLRNAGLKNRPGSVLWDRESFWRAARMGEAYGYRLVSVPGAYALCSVNGTVCRASECIAAPESFPRLAAALLRAFPAEEFCLCTPAGALPAYPVPCDVHGMLKPLGGASLPGSGGYLGLGMD